MGLGHVAACRHLLVLHLLYGQGQLHVWLAKSGELLPGLWLTRVGQVVGVGHLSS